jgi:stage V sporulation protein G
MPSRKTANGEYKDVAHPISPEFRTELQDKILAEYNAGHVEVGSGDSADE